MLWQPSKTCTNYWKKKKMYRVDRCPPPWAYAFRVQSTVMVQYCEVGCHFPPTLLVKNDPSWRFRHGTVRCLYRLFSCPGAIGVECLMEKQNHLIACSLLGRTNQLYSKYVEQTKCLLPISPRQLLSSCPVPSGHEIHDIPWLNWILDMNPFSTIWS